MTNNVSPARDSSVTAAVSLEAERDWILRPYNADTDDLYYLLGVAYSRGSAGRRAGASRAGWTKSDPAHPVPDQESIDAQKAFLEAHRPIWNWLLENADVEVAVDRLRPDTRIWGWCITSGPDVVHALGVKRDLIEAGFGREIAMDLLRDRWDRFQVVTLELPQMRAPRHGWRPSKDMLGFDKPKQWSLDPTWLVTRMVAR
jgi:hypothetical protein